MSEHLEKEIEDLKKVIEDFIKRPVVRPGWSKHLGTMISIMVLGSGIVATWTTLKVNLSEAQSEISALERKVNEAENRVRQIELKDAGDTQILNNIEEQVKQINKKLDEMRSR